MGLVQPRNERRHENMEMVSATLSKSHPKSSSKSSGAMERTLRELKAMIVSGELSPGEQIRQEEMAEQLKVSRVPLREAMNVLADQGLLFHRPHQGYFVTKRAPGEHAQIRRMLHLLENDLMLTLRWPDQDMLQSLRELNVRMRECSRLQDITGLTEINRQFHFKIFSLSPNHLILEEVRRLWSMVEPSMWTKFQLAEERVQTLIEHDRLIEAIEAHDRAKCVAEMENHRYSTEFVLPIELPGLVPDTPIPVNEASKAPPSSQ